jgi:hypothetical protein
MAAYGAFRFATETLRETPKLVGNGALSVYQVLSLVMIALGAVSFALRSRARDASPQEVAPGCRLPAARRRSRPRRLRRGRTRPRGSSRSSSSSASSA